MACTGASAWGAAVKNEQMASTLEPSATGQVDSLQDLPPHVLVRPSSGRCFTYMDTDRHLSVSAYHRYVLTFHEAAVMRWRA